MGIRSRLRRLERSGRLPCSECGQYGDEPLKFEVISHADDTDDSPEGPQYCPRCGKICGGRIQLTWD